MLSWTEAGAVQRPETIQIRVQRAYPGRIRAGAPLPTRSLSAAELEANLRHFTEGKRGPRTTPCTTLVLSGIGVLSRGDTAPLLRLARGLGIRRVVLHAGQEDLGSFDAASWRPLVDLLVVPLQPGADEGLSAGAEAVAACQRAGIRVSVNTVLDQAAVDQLIRVAALADQLQPDELTFTYPFPVAGPDSPDPPAIHDTIRALEAAVATLEAGRTPPRIKGLPACYLGPLARLLSPSTNRWYVDAEHQLQAALLFFPEVITFHKSDACRYCALDSRCDGFFSSWLRRPGVPPLEPVVPR